MIAATALRQVSDWRAQEALAGIASGAVTYALAVDEGAKFAPDATQMEARREGNGFRLSGRKVFVVDGGFSDRLLVLARTGEGLTLFDLPADRAGIAREARGMIDSRDAARVDFDEVQATGEDVLGVVDDAMTVLKPALEAGQAALAAEMSGLAAGAFGMTVGYLKERNTVGLGFCDPENSGFYRKCGYTVVEGISARFRYRHAQETGDRERLESVPDVLCSSPEFIAWLQSSNEPIEVDVPFW